MTLYYQGWSKNIIWAWMEIITHCIICLLIILLLIAYIWIFICEKDIKMFNKPLSRQQSSVSQSHSGSIDNNTPSKTRSKSRSTIRKTHEKIFTLMLFTSIIISTIYIYLSNWYSNISVLIFDIRSNNGCFTRILVGIGLYIQRLIIYTFFLFRLKVSFKDSALAMKDITFYILLSLLYITFIGSFIYLLIATLDAGFLCGTALLTQIAFFTTGFIDITFSILLTSLFVVKLRKLLSLSDGNINQTKSIKHIAKKLTLLCM